ncbi:MAG: zinc ABC transporter substrate-binding protein [Thermodesulfovibrionales bacterium]|nr:zinc ABC transporter substrate-binding protein [Thermodesulfovibrionales bacterium]
MKSLVFVMKIIFVIFVFLFFSSCEKRDIKKLAELKKITIITTLFPLYDFTKQIVGDNANVFLLIPPGLEPHSFNPKPSDIAILQKADLFIYTNDYMEPWVKGLLKSLSNKNLHIIDSSKGIRLLSESFHSLEKKHKHSDIDPHIWLDFSNALIMVDNILHGLNEKDSEKASIYRINAESYKFKLTELDEKYKKALNSCQKNIFVSGGHLSFSYLAKRYNLKYLSVYESLSPDAEPSPKQLANVMKIIKKYDIKYIFYEELIVPRVAQTIAKETGVSLLLLHAAHNISKEDFQSGATFISLMERNLKNLQVALICQ